MLKLKVIVGVPSGQTWNAKFGVCLVNLVSYFANNRVPGYDAQALPYLGVWITAGGYRGDCNCALEPSTGFYDGISRARENGSLKVIKPGEIFSFTLEICLENTGS